MEVSTSVVSVTIPQTEASNRSSVIIPAVIASVPAATFTRASEICRNDALLVKAGAEGDTALVPLSTLISGSCV